MEFHSFEILPPDLNRQYFFIKGRRQKKIADFQTYAQIGVKGSGKNLIQKKNLIGTKC